MLFWFYFCNIFSINNKEIKVNDNDEWFLWKLKYVSVLEIYSSDSYAMSALYNATNIFLVSRLLLFIQSPKVRETSWKSSNTRKLFGILKKFYRRRNNSRVNSIQAGRRIVISYLLPWRCQKYCVPKRYTYLGRYQN